MITIQHEETGETQTVASMDGYSSPPWFEGSAATDAAKTARRKLINRARDDAQDGGAETPSGVFDSTSRSREFLNGAAQLALMAKLASAPFSIVWTRADNTTVTLDADEMIAVGQAVAAHVDAMQQRARVLKGRIDEAETLEELEAIAWTLTDPE